MVTVIENMAGAGNIIGATLEDLGDVVSGVEDKTRVGVCLDTCEVLSNVTSSSRPYPCLKVICLQLSVNSVFPIKLVASLG